MSAPSYDTLSTWVDMFDDVLGLARRYDSVEVALTFSQPWVALLPGADLIRRIVAFDAANTWERAAAARARLRSAHAWLAQSRDSVASLGDGVHTWEKASSQALDVYADMARIAGQDRDWSGAGAEAQEAATAAQMNAQRDLTQATTALQVGCRSAQAVMSAVFSSVAMSLATELVRTLGVSMRAPSTGAGLFGLNSRMKSVASALESTAARYEAVRGGEGWSGQAASLREFFAKQCDLEEATRSGSRRALPA